MIATLDRKDWWLAAIDPATGRTDVRHHDRGALMIASQQIGFLPDHRLWFLSEQGGWFGLYLDDGQSTRPVATGPFEVANVQWSPDGRRAFFQCNRKEPGDHEVCRVNADGSDLRELTALDGVGTYLDLDAFRLSPDGRRLAVRYSGPYLPMQLALVDAETGETRRIGDTRGAALKARAAPLVEPQIVQVPSTHFPGTIWSKLFRGERPQSRILSNQYPHCGVNRR